jgi:hypothetical protein
MTNTTTTAGEQRPQGMVPGRSRRASVVERGSMRIVATVGVIAIATVIGAVMASQDVTGWITALVVSVVTALLAALLWSSRQL